MYTFQSFRQPPRYECGWSHPVLTDAPACKRDEGVRHACQTVEVYCQIVVLVLQLWQGRHTAHLVLVDHVGDADRVDMDVGIASLHGVRDRIVRIDGRYAVSDDDSDVLNVRSVAVVGREFRVVHNADAASRVCVSGHVRDTHDGVLQRDLVRVPVHMKDALCICRELDGSDAHLSRLNGQVIDYPRHEFEQYIPVVVGSVVWIVVANAARTVDHKHDVGPEVGALI